MGIFFAAGVWPDKSTKEGLRPVLAAGLAVLFLAASVFAARSFFQICDDEDAVAPMVKVHRSGAGFAGTEEYYPVGFDNSVLLQSRMPDGCLGSMRVTTGVDAAGLPLADPSQSVAQVLCDAAFASTSTKPEQLHIVVTMPRSGDLILRRIAYPAWRVTLNGREIKPHAGAEVPLIVIPVTKGPLDLQVDWTVTSDSLIGRWITALGALLLTGLCALEQKLGRPHLSSRG